MVLAKELADLCQTTVFAAGIERRSIFLGIELHAAELINVEGTSETTDTLLLENGRAAVFALHGNVANQKQRRKDNQGNRGCQKVSNPLRVAFKTIHSIGNEMVIFLNVFKVYHKFLFN